MRYAQLLILFAVLLSAPLISGAQELYDSYQGTYLGTVLRIVDETVRTIPGTDTEHLYQTISVKILDGPKENEVITIENDYLELEEGDKFYFNHNIHIDGTETYGVTNIYRTDSLLLLVALFVIAVIAFGGWQGVRSLVALAGSFAAIFYILMPGILHGWNPLLASILVASGVLFAAIFFTHGFNRESLVAYSGTMLAVLLTGIFAVFAVSTTNLSGFAEEASVYLNFSTQGSIDFTALLLGAIIIGVLGVLDDVAVTQAAVVTELFATDRTQSKKKVFLKALRVGREHVGALVNTLVLAYTGAALPLLLHFYVSASDVAATLNTELFATEIVRIIVGSIGLILAVPIVTLLAVFFLKDYRGTHSHSHGHSHT